MKKSNINKRNVQFLAAAALTAVLVAGQIQPTMVYGGKTEIQVSSLIPDNVTIENPVPLSDIALPSSEYGTLSWVDGSNVPSQRIESYDVVFRPYDSADLSRIDGWDGESDGIYSSVTVVVSSMENEDNSEEEWEEEQDTEQQESEEGYDESDSEIADDTSDGEESSDENYEDSQDSSDTEEEIPVPTVTPGEEETPEPTVTPEEETPVPTVTPGEEETSEPTVTPEEETPAPTVTPGEEETPEPTVTPGEEGTPAPTVTPGEEAPEPTVTPGEEAPIPTVTPEADSDNIFDRNEEAEDLRPTEAEDDLSEEEEQAAAEANHSCNGISVSGINLPWYVQFRATSGEDYQFTNETEANVFKSYEFELWDLKNNTEYEIPDGEYISVTVPVKAGYTYTIEHLLDSGAMETIVPSVDGSTMIFSTHSFSPFGIAGSRPLVGEEIQEDGYGDTDAGSAGEAVTPAPEVPSDNTLVPVTAAPEKEDETVQNVSPVKDKENISENESKEADSDPTSAVNTGDNTLILPFVILGVAAVVIVGVIIYLKRRKK